MPPHVRVELAELLRGLSPTERAALDAHLEARLAETRPTTPRVRTLVLSIVAMLEHAVAVLRAGDAPVEQRRALNQLREEFLTLLR